MKRSPPSRILLGALLLVPLGGCNVIAPFYAETTVVSTQPRPIGGPQGTAGQRVHAKSDFVRTRMEAVWTAPGFDPTDMFEFAKRVHARLNREDLAETRDDPYRYASRGTIVCVNPPVVLVEPVESVVTFAEERGSLSVPNLVNPSWWMVLPGSVTLPHGIMAGRSIATREGVTWIDLSAFDTPRPIVPGEDGRALLPVFWGHLELRPSGEGWKVRGIVGEDYRAPLTESDSSVEPKEYPVTHPASHTSTRAQRGRPRRGQVTPRP